MMRISLWHSLCLPLNVQYFRIIPGAVARSVACPLCKQQEKLFHSSADSRRASCGLLAKEWAFNTFQLPLGCLPRNSVVKKMTVPT